MDARRQRDNIFKPLREGTADIIAVLLDRKMWRRTFYNIGKLLSGQRLDDAGLWFSWRAAVITFVGLTLLVFLYRATSWAVRRILQLARPHALNQQRLKDAEVEFYRRLEEILSQRRLVRQPQQTQREFARQVGDALAANPNTARVAAIPHTIAECFYQVRFGNQRLSQLQMDSLDGSLAELSAAFSDVPTNGERGK